jgi:hypothetical protein
MSYGPRFSISNAIANALTRVERARGFLDAAKLSKAWLSQIAARKPGDVGTPVSPRTDDR